MNIPPMVEDPVRGPFSTLRKFAQKRGKEEQCELCGAVLFPVHRHLLEMANRKISCACDPCALQFQDVVGGRFKLIPRDAVALTDFHLTDAMWENFALPINLVFFFYSTPEKKIAALYPSPAGATESLLPLKAWEELVADNPILAKMEPDVEALLVNRMKAPECYLAPIDVCFELVGLIRMHWKGFSGGEEVGQKLDEFFARLKSQSVPAFTRSGESDCA